MRIFWLSNAPWAPSGYGVQTRLVLERLKAAGHEIAMQAFYGYTGGLMEIGGFHFYPSGAHIYGMDVWGHNAAHFKADVLISLIDAWVAMPENLPQGMRWCPWFPIDHDPIPPGVATKVRAAFSPITYSKFGEEKCREAGIPCSYIPHCVDTQVYQPKPKSEARARVGFPQDKFIVGMVAANKQMPPSRKSFEPVLEAFAAFNREYPDSLLYLHTHAGPQSGGMDIIGMAHYLGLQGKVFFPEGYPNFLGLSPEHMQNVFNSFDVFLNPAMGEGFGVPILEAQACGIPAITGDWTAMSEITFGGWKIPKTEALPFFTNQGSYQWIPFAGAIYERLKWAYHLSKNEREVISKKAIEGAQAYDADRVVEDYWLPYLERLQPRMDRAAQLQQRFASQVIEQRPVNIINPPVKEDTVVVNPGTVPPGTGKPPAPMPPPRKESAVAK